VEMIVSSEATAPLSPNCPLCYATYRSLEFTKKGWFYWRCRCGHVYVEPLPSPDETQLLYDQSYSDEQLEHSRAWFEALAQSRSDLLDEEWGRQSRGVLLDAGCGYGFFLNEARNRGWEVQGIDYSGHPLEFAQQTFGLEIVAEELQTAFSRLSENSIDVVTFWHVLEHLDRPGQVLDWAIRALKPGGCLILNSPNLDSMIYRLVGRHWSWIYTPGHVQYFSLDSVQKALEGRELTIQRRETWTHAPNLFFLVEDAFLHTVCDGLQTVNWSAVQKQERRLRAFAYSRFHQQVIQLKLFKLLYERMAFLDRWLLKRYLGHEFLIVARKGSGA